MRMPWKPWYPKHKGPLPDRKVLEMAAARELLFTWEADQNKEAIDKMLAKMDKRYGEGAEQRIRHYMREIRRNERVA
jgi:hypothetical protein